MSRWKRLEDLENNLSGMSVQEIRKELVFWRQHANLLAQPAKKLAIKRVLKIEKILKQKENKDGV